MVVLAVGVGIFLWGLRRLVGVLLEPFPAHTQPLVELVYQKRSLARGRRIVAIGGGTGQSTLLRGLKQATSNLTAIVTVADDGGSSGKLREELGIAPVGDIRNCITALADAEPTMTRLLQYRFPTDSPDAAGLGGHAFGNLLIAALSDIAGDFEEGVRLSNRVLAVRGQVVPVAPVPLTLHAELADGRELDGQSQIMRSRGIRRVWITPATVEASVDAVEAIRSAELIVLGPGSLYTSLLPSLLVPGIRSALEATSGVRVFVCNVATQPGETEGYTLSEHLAALHAHGVGSLVDVVLANDNTTRSPAGRLSRGARAPGHDAGAGDTPAGDGRRRGCRERPPTRSPEAGRGAAADPRRAAGPAGARGRPHRLTGRAVPAASRSSRGTTGPRPGRVAACRARGHRADACLLPCRDTRRSG